MSRFFYILIPSLLLFSSFKGETYVPEKELITPRQGKKDHEKILMEEGKTYFIELVASNKGRLKVRLVDSNQFPFKTIVARYENNPIRGASFTIQNPFAKGLSFNCFVHAFSEGYTKAHLPVVHGVFKKQWSGRSVFGIILSDFALVE